MPKKKKKKSKLPDVGKNSAYAPIRFDLEDDAEDMFLAAIENISEQSIAEKKNAGRDSSSRSRPKRQHAADRLTTLDLHGCKLDEAKQKVEELFLELLRSPGQTYKVRIITGKGIHSGGAGVLASEIQGYVLARYRKHISEIQESPHSVKVGGVPIRGHFDLIFRS